MPWVTFTDPELAHVGLTEETARLRYGRLTIMRWPYSQNARAQAERQTGGFLKVIASRGGKILGAGIVGAQAGELIQMWSLAMQKGIPLSAVGGIVPLSLTLAEMNQKAAEIIFCQLRKALLNAGSLACLRNWADPRYVRGSNNKAVPRFGAVRRV